VLERQGTRAGRWSLLLDLQRRVALVHHDPGHGDLLAAASLVPIQVHPLVSRCPGRPPANALVGKDFRDLHSGEALFEKRRGPRGNPCPGGVTGILRSGILGPKCESPPYPIHINSYVSNLGVFNSNTSSEKWCGYYVCN
jgi:hypothetical protein